MTSVMGVLVSGRPGSSARSPKLSQLSPLICHRDGETNCFFADLHVCLSLLGKHKAQRHSDLLTAPRSLRDRLRQESASQGPTECPTECFPIGQSIAQSTDVCEVTAACRVLCKALKTFRGGGEGRSKPEPQEETDIEQIIADMDKRICKEDGGHGTINVEK